MYLLSLVKVIITKATKTFVTGLVFTVFAARLSAGYSADALEESGMEETIAAVEVSKENEDTSLECSLTTDGSESRTMGALSEPSAYAEACVSPGTDVQRTGSSVSSINAAARETAAVETGSSSAAEGSYASLPANTDSHNNPAAAGDTGSSSVNADAGAPDGNTGSSPVYTANAADGNRTTAVSGADNSSANTADSNKTAAVSETDNSSAATAANAASNNGAAAADSTGDSKTYHHTTSIYADDDATLLRVEYLDENGKVVEYSKVTDYDKDTNSYTETVYAYDWDEEKEYVMRTNTYVDGELVSSENP